MDIDKFRKLRSKVIENVWLFSHQYFLGHGSYVFYFADNCLDKLEIYYSKSYYYDSNFLSFEIRKCLNPEVEDELQEGLLRIYLDIPSVGDYSGEWTQDNVLKYKKDLGGLINRAVVNLCDLWI